MVWNVLRSMFIVILWVSVKYNVATVDFFVEKWAVSKKISVRIEMTRTGGLKYIGLGAGRVIEST